MRSNARMLNSPVTCWVLYMARSLSRSSSGLYVLLTTPEKRDMNSDLVYSLLMVVSHVTLPSNESMHALLENAQTSPFLRSIVSSGMLAVA